MPIERFAKAILSDLSRQYDREETDRWLSEGGIANRGAKDQSASIWTTLDETVSVWTRELREEGCYPEIVLAAVKSEVRQAAASLVSELAADDITREAGQACIAAYFDLSISDLTSASPPPRVSIPTGVKTPGSLTIGRQTLSFQ